MTTSALRRFAHKAGLDQHVVSTLLFRGWSVIAGAASVFLMPLWLTPVQQGFYYTFASVLGLQIFFELGLSQVVIQLVGHEIAHLNIDAAQRLSGEEERIGKLASLARLLNKWYLIAAVLFAAICGAAGVVFFAHKNQLPWTQWIGIWSLLVVCTSINLAFMPRLAFMEGSGQVGKVARLRFLQGIIGYTCLWALLWLGAGLWVAMIIPAVSAVCTWYWLRTNGTLFSGLTRLEFRPEHGIAWRRDVMPFQWRIALSWISGFFIFYLFTPLVFAQRGAVEAGRLGMAMSVFSAVSTVGMSWVNAKTPTFAMLISRGERQSLDSLFRAVCIRSLAFTTLASIGVVALAYMLTSMHVRIMTRIAVPEVLVFLAIVCVLNGFIFAAAAYMRAHREEPMLPQSIVMGLATAAVAYFGSHLGVLTMVALYAAITAFIGVPWTAWLFRKYAALTS